MLLSKGIISKVGGSIAILTGGLAVIGWVGELDSLKGILPGFVDILPNIGLCFLLCGISLFFYRENRKGLYLYCLIGLSLAAVMIALLTWCEHLFTLDLGINKLLISSSFEQTYKGYISRMHPTTAFNFLLVSMGLILLHAGKYYRFVQTLFVIMSLTAISVFTGIVYSAVFLHAFDDYRQVPYFSAITFISLYLGIVYARPQSGFAGTSFSKSAGGMMLRRLLPIVLLLPLISGLIKLKAGAAGYYPEGGEVFLIILGTIIIAILVWRNAYKLHSIDMQREEAEKKIKLFNEELAQLVNERTEELHERNKKLIQEIAQRKQAETELSESEKKYLTLINTINEGIIYVDNDDKIQFVNKRFSDMVGYTEAELTGQTSYHLFFTKEDQEFIKEQNRLRTQGLSNQYEIQLRKQSGEWIWVFVNACPVMDNHQQVIGSIGTFLDITEQKSAKQKIRKSEQRYRLLAENATDMISRNTKDGIYIYVSPSCKTLLGYESDELLGHSIFEYIHVEDLKEIHSFYHSVFELPIAFTARYRIRKKDGTYIWFETTSRAIRDSDTQNIQEVIAISRDITERKNIEKQLQYKIKELDTFMYRASHDLRGPLASLMGLVNLAENSIKSDVAPPTEEIKQYVHMIGNASLRMDNILMDLVEITKIAQGKIQASTINFKLLVENVLSQLQYLPHYQEIKFKIEAPPVNEFKSDEKLLYSVFHHLIENSIKYKKDKQQDAFIDITVLEDTHHRIKITIADNGEGIHASSQDKVFDMFYRGNEKSTGSGLGLYTTKKAIEKLGGNIQMESDENQGTVFRISLPSL